MSLLLLRHGIGILGHGIPPGGLRCGVALDLAVGRARSRGAERFADVTDLGGVGLPGGGATAA